MKLTILTTTINRPTLPATLQSLRRELVDGDELVLVFDGWKNSADFETVSAVFNQANIPGKLLCTDSEAHNDWGNFARNLGLSEIGSDGYIYNVDDDDLLLFGARNAIENAARKYPGCFLIFRAVQRDGKTICWPKPVLAPNYVGNGNFVFPANAIRPLFQIGNPPEYCSDYYFIRDMTTMNASRGIAWMEQIIYLVRIQQWTVKHPRYTELAIAQRFIDKVL